MMVDSDMSDVTPPLDFSVSSLDDLKQRVCVAMLGINPADSVLVKAYFRLLLRLDYEIQWVTATEAAADLLLVNRGLSRFEKTQDFLQSLHIPVLYVESARDGAGRFAGDTLFLPLLDTQDLGRWLQQHVAAISGALVAPSVDDLSTPFTEAPIQHGSSTSVNPVKLTATLPPKSAYYISDLKEIIYFLQRSKTPNMIPSAQPRYVTLYDQHRLRIGVIDCQKRQFWIQQAGRFKLEAGWSLKVSEQDIWHPTGDVVDLKQWLWLALHESKSVTTLVSTEHLIQLKYWPKPQAGSSRRDLLRIMALLAQQPMSAKRLAQLLNLPLHNVHQVVASLYGSGCATLGEVVQDWTPEQAVPVKSSKGLGRLLASLRSTLRL